MSRGKIGIFWIVDNKIDGFKESMEDGENYGDTIQPSIDHFSYWEHFVPYYPHLRIFEYDEIPRGRVIYDKKNKVFVILSSKRVLTNKNWVKDICRFYEIDGNVEFRWDEHYEIKNL